MATSKVLFPLFSKGLSQAEFPPDKLKDLLKKWSVNLEIMPAYPSFSNVKIPHYLALKTIFVDKERKFPDQRKWDHAIGERQRTREVWQAQVVQWVGECFELGFEFDEFMLLLRIICYKPWPPEAELHTEFALTYLELRPNTPFSRGAKKLLIRKLRSQPLIGRQLGRIDALIRREVRESQWSGGIGGVFAEYWRTTAKLNPPGLLGWLEETAIGAVLHLGISNVYHLYDEIFELYDKDPYLGPREVLFDHRRGFGWGVEWPSLKIVKDPNGGWAQNRSEEAGTRHNAWVMLTRANQLREFHNW